MYTKWNVEFCPVQPKKKFLYKRTIRILLFRLWEIGKKKKNVYNKHNEKHTCEVCGLGTI